MQITIRQEDERDFRAVEELTREAFWNVHYPGCDEHLLIHNLRGASAFVRELDYVAALGDEAGKIVGSIVYAKAVVRDAAAEHSVLTFGPLSVLPRYQNKGIGSALIERTITLAVRTGGNAIIIYGDPEYYKRFGFAPSKRYNITNKYGRYPAALLALELYPGALLGVKGEFDEGAAYSVDAKELEAYDKGFAPKAKGPAPSQQRFNELVGMYL
jgi:predicted N-acetyltransferase YhbS